MNRFATLICTAMDRRNMTPEQLALATGISLSFLNGPFMNEEKCSLNDSEKELLADALHLDRRAVLSVPDSFGLENVQIFPGRGSRRNVVVSDDFKKSLLTVSDFMSADLDYEYPDLDGDEGYYFEERV